MSESEVEQLRARVEALEAENAALKAVMEVVWWHVAEEPPERWSHAEGTAFGEIRDVVLKHADALRVLMGGGR